jgi:hypothetical protein
VDTPVGDLNHDEEVEGTSPTMLSSFDIDEQFGMGYSTQHQEAHYYQECSNKGVCDRGTGVCQCYDGYTGSSCQRSA